MNTFITSDVHHNHFLINKYCNRPFITPCSNHKEIDWQCPDCKVATNDKQTQELIRRWNEKVGPKDLVYNLGDFIWTKDPLLWTSIVLHLNGKQRIIVGNHDQLICDNHGCVRPYNDLAPEIQQLLDTGKIEWIKNYYEAKICGQYYILNHFPLGSYHKQHYGSRMIHGHCHSNYTMSWPQSTQHGKIMDAGVDSHNYEPVSFDEVNNIMKTCTNEKSFKFEG